MRKRISFTYSHDLLEGNDPGRTVDLASYQPDPEQFRHHYESLVAQEKRHEQIQTGLKCTLLVGLLYSGYKIAQSAYASRLATAIKNVFTKSTPCSWQNPYKNHLF